MNRRSSRLLVPVLVAASLIAAACGGDDSADDTDATGPVETSQASEPADSAPTAITTAPVERESTEGSDDTMTTEAASDTTLAADSGDSPYPVTITHRAGETTIEQRPERIVSLNVQWTDALLAMGETPTAYMLSSAVGEPEPYPWQAGMLDGVDVISSTGPIPFEKVAELQPDLILVTFAAPTESDLALLTEIAPTIGLLGDFEVDPWVDQVEVLGQVLGEPETAAAVIAGVDDEVAAVAADLPGLEGATYTFANLVPGDSIYVIADPNDGASRLFNSLGMQLEPDIVALDEGAVGRIQISYEEVGLLQADLVGVLLNGQDPGSIVGLSEIPSAQTGALAIMELSDIVGLNTPSPLSVPYILDLLMPSLRIVATEGATE
ncbi:MAG: hypothetical protein CL424_14070 [Acidimicrobiaceae bacterium]|nr:hypothetical protein [Acidimicrobiaceae bacterium]